MAKELQLQARTGWTVYAVIRNFTGQAWNGSSWETYSTGNLGNYDIPMTEEGTASGHYTADFPATIVPTTLSKPYSIYAYRQAGGLPAEGDREIGSGKLAWKDPTGRFYDVITFGAVDDVGPSATAFETDLTETTDNHYRYAVCSFRTGALKGQQREITAYDGTLKKITVFPAFTEAPADTDEFVIVGLVA